MTSKKKQKKASEAADSIPATPLPNLWAKDALLIKAQRYAEEMHQHERDDWRFGLWSTLMLELLARAALSNVSPVLLANTNKEESWGHLYYALGHLPKTKKFVPKSIDVTSVFNRLAEILPDFDPTLAGFCAVHLPRRNEELHSGGTPFDGMPSASWQPLFYEVCDVLMKSMGATLADLIGDDHAVVALKTIAAAKSKSAKAVAKAIHAHKTAWEALSEDERKKLVGRAELWATRQAGHRVKCPACGSDALVVGTPTAPPVVKLKDGLIVEAQEFLPGKLECVACDIKIAGLAHLHACGLASPYKSTFTYDPSEYYGVEDSFMEYEPDNND